MCLMEVFTHATCGHRTDVLINSCLFSALIGRACSPNHRRVAGFLTTKSQRYCRRCYDTGVSNIRVDYGIWYRDIVLYAWGLGKNVSDVRERLTALETDERARLEEWAMECGRRERAKEGRVGLCERCCFCCDQCAAVTRQADTSTNTYGRGKTRQRIEMPSINSISFIHCIPCCFNI